MAETKNIDEIAGIISSKIFHELRWSSSDETDINWDCCMESHLTKIQITARDKAISESREPKSKTHPTDVVFSYVDPYDDEITQYIQTDLKSYNKTTMENNSAILKTIRSLSQQVECANRSQQWREKFNNDPNGRNIVHGLLFIYNHDNEYDAELLSKISTTAVAGHNLPENSMMAIFDPKLIRFLLSVTEEIDKRRNIPVRTGQINEQLLQKIPEFEECSFFYPDKHNKVSTKGVNLPASIEMITSGMLFYSYQHNYLRDDEENRVVNKVLNIFWHENVTLKEQFVFILEYIINYQLLNQFDRIFIMTPFASASSALLTAAINSYARMYSFNRVQLQTFKDKIKSLPIHNQVFSIFDFEVASRDHKKICNLG